MNNQSINKMASCSIQATLASILQRLRVVEDHQSRSYAAIAKLRLEMEDASGRIQELEFSHESSLREINSLLQRFGEQMSTSRRKEQEKLRAAFVRLREEIEEERNTCRLLKLQNKKLAKELEEANIVAVDAGQELDRERQARELMEEVCNELAREIGEDKAEVEQLKQEQAKSREMVEEELKMMRMASLWRDERVRTKVSEAQLELDDKHPMGLPFHDLRSRIEEFVSTVSAVSREPHKSPMHVENIEEKQQSIIQQAQMLRHALELSMQQQRADEDGFLHAQADMNVKEEKIFTPITQDQHMSRIDQADQLQVKPISYMLSYSKKPCKDIRRPRATSGDDHDYHAGAFQQARKHLHVHDNDVETQQDMGSGRIIMETDHTKSLHQSPSPGELMHESNKIWLPAPEKRKIDQGSPAMSLTELQKNESNLQRSLSIKHHAPLKGVHRKQLSLHFDASEDGDFVWEDHLTPSIHVHSYSDDDASHVYCTDKASMHARHEPSRGKHTPATSACDCVTKRADGMDPWRNSLQEEIISTDDGIGHHAQCLMRREYEDAKSLCAGGAEDGEHGELDGFYFEPVMDADSLEDHCKVHYVQAGADRHLGIAEDEGRSSQQVGSMSNAYKSSQQNKSPKQLNGRTSARYSGTSAKSSCREEAPYKLVVPAPAIRVPIVKAQYTSPKSARSASPSKPQVLQCFRPPPTSPEHNAAIAAPLYSKSHVILGSAAAGEGPAQVVMEAHANSSSSTSHTSKAGLLKATSYNKPYNLLEKEGAYHTNSEVQRQDDEASSSIMLEDKKGNSLRTELLKARELDLQQYVEHVPYNVQKAAAAAVVPPPPPPPKSSTSSSSFRFSPLRRSLTNNPHAEP